MIPLKFSLLTTAAAAALLAAAPVRAGNARKSAGAQPVSIVSLESAIRRVLADNPDACIAAARIAGAQGMLVQAESAARPQLSVQSSHMRTNQPFSVFGTALKVPDEIPEILVPSAAQLPLRPELQAAGSMVRAAEARVREAAAGTRPSVHAFGQVEHNRGAEFDGDGSNYTLGIRAQWNLWDGGRTHGQIQEARAALTAAVETGRRSRLAVNTEIQRARFALQEADEPLKASATSVDLAAESVKITRQRFEGGLALSTQLIDAETALTASCLRRAEAEADRRLAVASLRRALGLPMITLYTK